MSSNCAAHRLPRAGIDPIDSEFTALLMVWHMMTWPTRAETIALLLDDQRRGISVLVVGGTDHPDALFDVVDLVAESGGHGEALGAAVLASVRPGEGLDPGDVDRWLESSDVLADRGVELLEWFVVGRDICCPRDQLGEPPRWSG